MARFEQVADKCWPGIYGFPVKIRDFQFRTLKQPELIREHIKNIIFPLIRPRSFEWAISRWGETKGI